MVETLTDYAEFILLLQGQSLSKVALAHAFQRGDQAMQWFGNARRLKAPDQKTGKQNHAQTRQAHHQRYRPRTQGKRVGYVFDLPRQFVKNLLPLARKRRVVGVEIGQRVSCVTS